MIVFHTSCSFISLFIFLVVVRDQGFYCLFCSSKPHFTRTQVSHLNQQVLFWTIFLLFSLLIKPFCFHSVDLASLLPKAGVDVGGSMDSDLGVIVDGPSAEDLGQSLVFTNSHHNGRTATHSYAHATANSYAHAASGGTTYAHSALVMFIPNTRFLCYHINISYPCLVLVLISSILPVLSSGLWFWVPEYTQANTCL